MINKSQTVLITDYAGKPEVFNDAQQQTHIA